MPLVAPELIGVIKSPGMAKTNVEQNAQNRSVYEFNEYSKESITECAKQWEGFGTALKPAHEPIVVARKPLSEKTVADNILKWGTGGINIDDCRIPTSDKLNGGAYAKNGGKREQMWGEDAGNSWRRDNRLEYKQPEGRFPANIILDEEAGKILDEQSGISKPKKERIAKRGGNGFGFFDDEKSSNLNGIWPSDPGGGASRFFYCAKASKTERGDGNNHPTVKPISLMRYLVRLVTPQNGIVLDPFAGSGTTLIASKLEGFSFVGIEKSQEYCGIANNRIEQAKTKGVIS